VLDRRPVPGVTFAPGAMTRGEVPWKHNPRIEGQEATRVLYDHIIVPFDGSTRSREVADAAADLTTRLDSHLVLLTSGDVGNHEALSVVKGRAMRMSDEKLDFWVDAQRRPAAAVAESVHYRPTSLVAMHTHARTGVDRAVFGSIAEQVLRATDVPVLLFGPKWSARATFEVNEVVAAVDLSTLSDEVLPLAATWSRGLQVPCTLVHVPPGGGRGRHRHRDADTDHDAVERRLAALVAEVRPYVMAVGFEVLDDGDPAERLVARAAAHAGSVLVLATHNRAGLDRMTSGSVTIAVARSCPAPVLVSRGGLRSLGNVD